MKRPLPDQLARILEHLSLESKGSVRFAGILFPPFPAAAGPAFPHPLPIHPLVRNLQSILYAYCYSRPFSEPPLAPLTAVTGMDRAFVAQLSAGNQSRAMWDSGWEIYLPLADGSAFAKKGDRQHLAAPGTYIAAGDQRIISEAGTIISIWRKRESTAAQPGFYYAYGEAPGDAWDDHTLVRFYFHVGSAGAPRLLQEVTGALNAYEVPFQFKVLNEPSVYGRTDSAVLYLARRYYDIAARLFGGPRNPLAALLQPEIPLFTRRLIDGIGVADDPANGESFGMHRCRLVAEGIVDAFRLQASAVDAQIQAVRSRFALNGLDMDVPYLGAGFADYPPIPGDTQEPA